MPKGLPGSLPGGPSSARNYNSSVPIGLESRPRRAPSILAKEGPDAETVILLNPDDGQYYTLEGVGGRVWELCDGTRTVADVVAALCEEYEASPATVEADVLELLSDLESEDLVRSGEE
jgi:pyrroloquinoline quinone biosynthesis protein D